MRFFDLHSEKAKIRGTPLATLATAATFERSRQSRESRNPVADVPANDLSRESRQSRKIPTDHQGLPCQTCYCSSRRFWKEGKDWRCSACHPIPECFLGETVTVPGPERQLQETMCRADLEAVHSAVVCGVPLTVVLDKAEEADYADLVSFTTLEAFARSLMATGAIGSSSYRDTSARASEQVWVRCCDCAHHIPHQTDPEHGIGTCKIAASAQWHPAPWAKTKRRCSNWRPRQ